MNTNVNNNNNKRSRSINKQKKTLTFGKIMHNDIYEKAFIRINQHKIKLQEITSNFPYVALYKNKKKNKRNKLQLISSSSSSSKVNSKTAKTAKSAKTTASKAKSLLAVTSSSSKSSSSSSSSLITAEEKSLFLKLFKEYKANKTKKIDYSNKTALERSILSLIEVSSQKNELKKQQKKQLKLLHQQQQQQSLSVSQQQQQHPSSQQQQQSLILSQSLQVLNVPNIISTIKTIQNRIWNKNEKEFLQQFRLWSPICDLKVVFAALLDQRKILHDR